MNDTVTDDVRDYEEEVAVEALQAESAEALEALLDDPLADDLTIPEVPPSPSLLRQNEVNGMLRSMSALRGRVAEYDTLHENEIARLNERRDKIVGPLQRRYDWLEAQVHAYALAAYRLDGTAKTQLPYGTIKSTATRGDQIAVDDEKAVAMIEEREHSSAALAMLVERRAKVFVGELRKWLDTREGLNTLRRVVRGPGSDDAIVLDKDQEWTEPFRDGQDGVWMDVETGELLDGITWTPSGDDGCGRNFKIELA